jgi:hypothetical protein
MRQSEDTACSPTAYQEAQDEGLPDCPLLELSSNGGDREPGTDAGLGGADDVRRATQPPVERRKSSQHNAAR